MDYYNLTFKKTEGGRKTLRVNDGKSGLSALTLEGAMGNIIGADIFEDALMEPDYADFMNVVSKFFNID